jgi:hypothetical protein
VQQAIEVVLLEQGRPELLQPDHLAETRRYFAVQPSVLNRHGCLLAEGHGQVRVAGAVVTGRGLDQRLHADHPALDDERHSQLAVVVECFRGHRHARRDQILCQQRSAAQIVDEHGFASATHFLHELAQGTRGWQVPTHHLVVRQRAAVREHHRFVVLVEQDDFGGLVLDDLSWSRIRPSKGWS